MTVASGEGDIEVMDESLRLGCCAAFEGVHAEHLVNEKPAVVPVPGRGNALLFFSVHGEAAVASHSPGRPAPEVMLRPNEALLVPPGEGTVSIRLAASSELYTVSFRQHHSGATAARARLDVPDHVTVQRPGRLTGLVRRITSEIRQENPSRAVLHHLVVLVLCELARSSRPEETVLDREAALENIASRVDAFVAAHYHLPISTPDIARELHYNPDYLERAYRSERHMSIREAIHARRIKEAAAQLLLQRGKGVAEIGALCGYADPGYFRRVFKRATNMTPHGWRLVNAATGEAAGMAAAFRA